MSDSRTARLRQIAFDLDSEGAYTSGSSVRQVTQERDDLLAAIRPFLRIEERATHSYGVVTQENVCAARHIVEAIDRRQQP